MPAAAFSGAVRLKLFSLFDAVEPKTYYNLQNNAEEDMMVVKEHGVGISLKRYADELFVELSLLGKLTHEDYELFVPMIDKAMQETPDVKMAMLADMRELEGWEARAAWDDFRFGLNHRSDFKKLAIVGDARWQKLAAKITDWFVSGETRYFETREAALAWLQEGADV